MTLLELMLYIFTMGPQKTRGTLARENAEVIAEGAIRGLLTTQITHRDFGNQWRLTALGVHELGLKNPPLKDIE